MKKQLWKVTVGIDMVSKGENLPEADGIVGSTETDVYVCLCRNVCL